jgi:hypothetical protein
MSFYVNMVDRFLSGWGEAKGGVSRLSVRCDTLDQAEAIQRAALDREEMRYVVIAEHPARKRTARDHVSIRDFDEMGGSWRRYYAGERRAS